MKRAVPVSRVILSTGFSANHAHPKGQPKKAAFQPTTHLRNLDRDGLAWCRRRHVGLSVG